MVITIIQDGSHDIEALLDETKAVLQQRSGRPRDLIFVFPLAHVRGMGNFPLNGKFP